MVFGALREGHAYSAPCRTSANGEFDNRIIWYFVDDDAPVYEGLNAFEPRVDNIYDLAHGTLEKSALRPCPRKHYSGRDIWFRDASGVIGTADDFAGRTLAGVCQCQEGPPHPPCVSGPHSFNMFGLAHVAAVPLAGEFAAGLRLGVRPTKIPDLVAQGGLAFGHVETFIPAPPLELFGGLDLAGVLVRTPSTPIELRRGLGLGVEPTYIPSGPLYHWRGLGLGDEPTYIPTGNFFHWRGLGLGGVLSRTPSDPITLRGGLGLGVNATYIPSGPLYHWRGLALGVESQTVPVDGVELDGAVAFGVNLDHSPMTSAAVQGLALAAVDPDEGGELEPGISCEEATEIELGVPVAGHFDGFDVHFWTVTIAVDTVYHVKILSLSGDVTSVLVQTGDDCVTLDDQFSLFASGECNTFTEPTWVRCLIRVDGGMGGVGDYELVIDEGTCP